MAHFPCAGGGLDCFGTAVGTSDCAVVVHPHFPCTVVGKSDCAAVVHPHFRCTAVGRSGYVVAVRRGAAGEGGASGCGCRVAAAMPLLSGRRIALSGCPAAPASRGSGGEDIYIYICVCMCIYMCVCMWVYACMGSLNNGPAPTMK